MCRSAPYLSLNALLHPPQDHCFVSSSSYGSAWRQMSGFTFPTDEELETEALDGEVGSNSADESYEFRVWLGNVNR